MAGGDPEDHHSKLQIEALRGPADADQSEKHEAGGIGSNGVETSASSHADGGFHENGRGRGHSHHAARITQNRTRAQKTDALDNIRSDSRTARIAKALSDFAGKNGE